MELLGLLAIGIVVGIPTIAIVALVRSNAARRLVEENSYTIADLRGEIAGLRRDLTLLSAQRKKAGAASIVPETAESRADEPLRAAQTSVEARLEVDAAAAFTPLYEQAVTPPKVTEEAQAAMNVGRESAADPAASTHERRVSAPIVPETPVPSKAASAESSHVAAPLPSFSFAADETKPPREDFAERLKAALPFEQVLGMNLFAKIGIVLLVLGFALLGRVALLSMGAGARVALLYATAGAMLGGGIWLERRERYRLVGRTGIGGGWALLFFTTYAMHHVTAMTVLRSNTVDCILLLGVAVAMVAHTLRYRSQLVTGLAFLLAFWTVALSQDSVYALSAGVILAVGIAAIALRKSWFELEVFGILASYTNHFYWLYKLYPDGIAGHAFPQFWPSATILVLYWAVFRFSYIARRIHSAREEAISTIAALLNTVLLLVTIKFQATHLVWAFYALLGLGAIEFCLGQLAVTRRRRAAFALLTILGTLLMFSAVPFKFSGNNIALFWMIAAEALLVAGIVQRERLFRQLGLLAGLLTGAVILFEARHILEFRQSSESPLVTNGILLLTCSVLFYLNAHFVRNKWSELFERFEGELALGQSYLGCVTAFLGVWALFPADWTAVGWVALLLVAAFGWRFLRAGALRVQAWALAAAVATRAVTFNCHFGDPYPHHIATRLVSVPLLALGFYLVSWALSESEELPLSLGALSLWAGTSLLATLAWLEIAQPWVALIWVAFAVALSITGRCFRLRQLSYQEHALAVATVAQLLLINLNAQSALERCLPLIASAAVFYAVSRFCAQRDAFYFYDAAWLHTWTATALLAALAWHDSPQPWLAVLWIFFALALAVIDRIFRVEELPWQAHGLAALAVCRAVTYDFFAAETWRGVPLRLITISILVAALYALARWVRLPEKLNDSGARHIYTWVATCLAAWMLWDELQALHVAPALGVFGLLLFELGMWRHQKQLRLQGYSLIAASFARIFFVNLTAAPLPGAPIGPRLYTVLPLALIDFYVWARLQANQENAEVGAWPPSSLFAYFGTGTIAALVYYEMVPAWIVAGWAFMVLVLMLAALVLDKEVFLEQSVLLAGGVVVRGLAHNIFGASNFAANGWRGNFQVLCIATALLFGALPLAFRVRARYAERPCSSRFGRFLALHRPEQILFFAPLVLIVFAIAVRMNPGMVTLSWGVAGVAVILLGLLAGERSYRITGLLLLLLCVAKIVFRDAWMLNERDRYLTFIVLGAALTLVSMLYSRYRDQVSRLL